MNIYQTPILDQSFKKFYTQKLKEKCKDLKLYNDMEDIIKLNNKIKIDTKHNNIQSENITFCILLIFYTAFLLTICYFINVPHLNFMGITYYILSAIFSLFFLGIILFLIFGQLSAFTHAILNINKKPKNMSFKTFYYFFYFGISSYINNISHKIMIESSIFYSLIQETQYTENEKNKMIEKYKKAQLEDIISLSLFSQIVAKTTIDFDYGEHISIFFKLIH